MSNQQQFEMAVMLCSVAEELDYAKNDFPDELRECATSGVALLHRLAEILAGDRAAEIYGQADE